MSSLTNNENALLSTPMPRKKLPNPSAKTLYMRKYRDSKLTEKERLEKATRERVSAYRNNPQKKHVFKELYNYRRREIYRARRVLEVNHPLKFRGLSEEMTVEDALYILRDKGVRDLIAHDPKKNPPKHKGRPRLHLLDTQAKVNDKLRELVLAAGLKPASPQLLPDDPNKEVFTPARCVKVLETPEQRKAREERNAEAREKYAKGDKKSSTDTSFKLPSATAPILSTIPKTEADIIRERLTSSLISQGKMDAPAEPVVTEDTPDESMFGGKTFTFA